MPSEKLFSRAGEVVTARRSNIKPKNEDMISLFNKTYSVLALCSDLLIFCLFGGGGQYRMVSYRIVSVYHVNTQYRIESPLPGIAHLYHYARCYTFVGWAYFQVINNPLQ